MTDKEIYKELWEAHYRGEEEDEFINYFYRLLEHMRRRGRVSIDCSLTKEQCLIIIEALNKL